MHALPRVQVATIALVSFAACAFAAPRQATQASPQSDPKATAWELLSAAAHHRESPRRVKAVRALGVLRGDPEGEALALAALEDATPEVRAAAADALGEMRSAAAIPRLLAALDDRDVTVAWAASAALLAMKDGQAYDIPYEILTGRRKGNASMSVQAHVALRDPGRMADIVVTHGINFAPYGGYALALVKALQGRSDLRARAAAALALAHDPDPRAGHALIEAAIGKGGGLERESTVRVAALRAIAERGDTSLLPGIAPALTDEDESVRLMAAAAVLRLTPSPRRPG